MSRSPTVKRKVARGGTTALRSRGYGDNKVTGYRTYQAKEKTQGPQRKQKGKFPYYAVAKGSSPGIHTDWNTVRHMRPRLLLQRLQVLGQGARVA